MKLTPLDTFINRLIYTEAVGSTQCPQTSSHYYLPWEKSKKGSGAGDPSMQGEASCGSKVMHQEGCLTLWRCSGVRQEGPSVLLAVSEHPSASSNAMLLLSPGSALLWVPNHGLILDPGSHNILGPLSQAFTFRPEVTQPKFWQFPCYPRAPRLLLLLTVATEHQQGKPACCPASPIYATQVTQITTSDTGLSECLCLMAGIQNMKEKVLSSLPRICSERRRGPQGADFNSLGVQASLEPQSYKALPAYFDCHAGKVPSLPTGVLATALWANGESREAGVREVLTHKVRQQDD